MARSTDTDSHVNCTAFYKLYAAVRLPLTLDVRLCNLFVGCHFVLLKFGC